MARGVARSTRGGQGGRTINARTGNDANRIARKRSKARGSQRKAERIYRQNRADQRANRLAEKGVDIRTGRTFKPTGGNLNAATGNPARQTDRVLVTPAPGDRRRGGGLNAIRNARNARGGQGRRTISAGSGSANQLQRILQGRRNFDGSPTGGNAGGGGGRTGNAGGGSTGNAGGGSTGNAGGGSTGNPGGGSTSGDPHQNRGSRRAASATAPTPAVRPRPSEARAARGQLIKQMANRRRSQRAA